jgi:hypothetical protein
MGVMIDIIGSTIIRGAIVLVILNINVSLNNSLTQKTVRAALKQKTVVPAQILTDDIRLAGYNQPFSPVGTTLKPFAIAKADEIQFLADLNSDSTTDVVRYYLGAAPVGSTHRVLYRQLNGGTSFELARDVISLTFTYYNSVGFTIAPGINKSGIKSISIKLKIESNIQVTEGIGTDNTARYETAYWERTLFPQNL